jgi:NADH dehydrogenase [ubiquinone] 1 alpha subcomplex assembly factor 5
MASATHLEALIRPRMTAPVIFDTRVLDQRRARAAANAEDHDFLLRRIADDFAERLALIRRAFPLALDIGAHHGVVARHLAALPGIETFASLEPNAILLDRCSPPRIQATLEALPIAEGTLDLATSALSLQWVNDLPGTLIQICRALKPDGLFMGALLGGETLTELRQCWLQAETEVSGGASPRVAPFADVRDVGGLVQRAGFALPVVDSDSVHVTYANPLALMREIKAMGASNMLSERRRVPVTRSLLLRAAGIYAERFALPNGRIPATFEILTITAWRPDPSQPKPLKPGSAQVSLADVLQPPRQPTPADPSATE